jgi:hypothetical protein
MIDKTQFFLEKFRKIHKIMSLKRFLGEIELNFYIFIKI